MPHIHLLTSQDWESLGEIGLRQQGRQSKIFDDAMRSDKIKIKVTVIGKGVIFIGPCNTWFDRKEGGDWEAVGMCPDTNFTDEPFGMGAGEEMELSLPMSNESEYHYSYSLTSGTYRYGIAYWAQNKLLTIYSPAFKIVE